MWSATGYSDSDDLSSSDSDDLSSLRLVKLSSSHDVAFIKDGRMNRYWSKLVMKLNMA